MSWFVDRKATDRLVLGACRCPGTPHPEGDWIELRTQISASEIAKVAEGDSIDMLALLAVSWSLLDNDGSKAPLDREHFDALFGDLFPPFNEFWNQHVQVASLPNVSGAASPSTSRANGSRRPTPTRAR